MNFIQLHKLEFEKIELQLKKSVEQTGRLSEAMAYSLLGSGKRLRPWLTLESANACGQFTKPKAWDLALGSAVAVEYVHTYSLIHDDLPAMDDDDFRRGRPSSHKQFDESTAILAGDALLSDAFFHLGQAKINAGKQCFELSKAIGSRGMILGQMKDIYPNDQKNEAYFLEVHQLKTGKLFECACVLGALSVGAADDSVQALRRFGLSFGVAFQLIDDLQDNSAAVTNLGKARIYELACQYVDQAVEALSPLGENATELSSLAKEYLSVSTLAV